jgi:hypothetical protein
MLACGNWSTRIGEMTRIHFSQADARPSWAARFKIRRHHWTEFRNCLRHSAISPQSYLLRAMLAIDVMGSNGNLGRQSTGRAGSGRSKRGRYQLMAVSRSVNFFAPFAP